jgi:hypothetical protein
VAGLAIGLWLGNDFGVTYDELLNAENGAAALRAFEGSDDYYRLPALPDHGPVYFMLMAASSRWIHGLAPSWSVSDGRHLTHYFMFLLATACFYLLCLRLSGRNAAWMATVLFATQPLLLGHGFINQKDTPFMALFLATFVTGILAGDRLARAPSPSGTIPPANPGSGNQGIAARIASQWRALAPGAKWLHGGIALGLLLLASDLLWLGGLRQLGETLLNSAYGGRAPGLLQSVFDIFASDAHKTPLTYYVTQYRSHYLGLRLPLAAIAILAIVLVSAAYLPSLREWLGLKRSTLSNAALWISALLLGATICVRQLGMFVGGLVSLYWLYRARSKAAVPLAVYWGTAAIVTYVTWPYLWPSPVERFSESFFWAAQFPSYDVFFEGRWVTADTRPWYYLPKLVGLQLTEPALILILFGAGLAIFRSRKDKARRFLFLLLALWIGVPAFGVMVLDMTVYGNIRHLLFILPAVLAFSAVAFDWVLLHSRKVWLAWAVFALAIIPGIASLIYLHPYEYIYLNSFTGGVSGGFERYELDHECTSIREGIEQANRLVPPDSQILLVAMAGDIRQYARPDLLAPAGTSPDSAEFVLACNWPETVELSQQGFLPVYSVHRGDAILATLWRKE